MKVKDLMMPVAECPRVSVDRSIYDAIVMLEANRERFRRVDYRPRVLLIEDEHYRVIGSVRHIDILRALLGSYSSDESVDQSIEALICACKEGFENSYKRAKDLKMKSIVHIPSDVEFIDQDASLEEGACRLMSGPYLHLFVRSGTNVAGILRMSDLFIRLCHGVKMSGPR